MAISAREELDNEIRKLVEKKIHPTMIFLGINNKNEYIIGLIDRNHTNFMTMLKGRTVQMIDTDKFNPKDFEILIKYGEIDKNLFQKIDKKDHPIKMDPISLQEMFDLFTKELHKLVKK
jgi:hypothetical protein